MPSVPLHPCLSHVSAARFFESLSFLPSLSRSCAALDRFTVFELFCGQMMPTLGVRAYGLCAPDGVDTSTRFEGGDGT